MWLYGETTEDPRDRWDGPGARPNASKERRHAKPYPPTPPMAPRLPHALTSRPAPSAEPLRTPFRAPLGTRLLGTRLDTRQPSTPALQQATRRKRLRPGAPLSARHSRIAPGTPSSTRPPPCPLPGNPRRRRGPGPHPRRTRTGSRPVNRRPPVRMCARCQRTTSEPVLVHQVHAATGPGFNVYACAECAEQYPPLTDVLELLDATARPSRMSIRVYKVTEDGTKVTEDGTAAPDHGETRVWTGSRFDPTPRTAAFPPCSCPKCRRAL